LAVTELYAAIPGSPGLVEPPKQLKGFVKVALAPRRHRTVTVMLGAGAFSYWDASKHSWRLAPGCDTILVGSSSRELPLRHRVCPR
jgi:beta-glucosidase